LALVGVIVQGVMGGLRVTRISTDLAMVHGCFGQAFFAYLACLTAWTSRTWVQIGSSDIDPVLVSAKTSTLATGSVVLVYGQVVAGAWLRHFPAPGKLYLHAILGVVVVVTLTLLTARVRREPVVRIRGVRITRSVLAGLAHFQLILGVLAWWVMRPFDGTPKGVTDAAAFMRTAHQANGALLLAFTAVLALWVFRARTAGSTNRSPDFVSEVQELEAACPS
jgi:cytochrome c oxidase assembly protein subunit 15